MTRLDIKHKNKSITQINNRKKVRILNKKGRNNYEKESHKLAIQIIINNFGIYKIP